MKKNEENLISVLVPLKNQMSILPSFLGELHVELQSHFDHYEIILIDYGSQDLDQGLLTSLLATVPYCRYLQLSRELDQEVAIYCGLENAIGDFCVVLSPNEDPPALVSRGIALAMDGNEIIYGLNARQTRETWLAGSLAKVFHYYCKKTLGLELPRASTHFRVFSRRIVNSVTQTNVRYPLIKMYGSSTGMRSLALTYEPLDRGHTQEPVSIGARVRYGLEIIFASSNQPLRQASLFTLMLAGLGTLGSGIGLILGAWPVSALGWLSLQLFATALVFAGQFWLATEYLGRILEEAQSRPLYYIAKESVSARSVNEAPNVVAKN